MQAFLLPFPEIHPEIFSVTVVGVDLALRWYAVAYIVGILLGWWIAVRVVSRPALWQGETPPMTKSQIEDLLTWVILGVVLGGRLGFVLFYRPLYYLANPVEILLIWEGGMAFHGGLIGVIVAVYLFNRRYGIAQLSSADVLAVATPLGLMFGRIANFVNAELYGRPTDVPWAMKFPTMCTEPARQGCLAVGDWFYYGDEVARHPSQLYQASLEGLALAIVLLWLAFRRDALKTPGLIAGVFFAGYGIARFIVEFFRGADPQFISDDNPIGFIIGSGSIGITMGQLLSLPMLFAGVALVLWVKRRG